ncbi:hypothetical protein ACJJTC_010825 [Scirpophaga incertulas]
MSCSILKNIKYYFGWIRSPTKSIDIFRVLNDFLRNYDRGLFGTSGDCFERDRVLLEVSVISLEELLEEAAENEPDNKSWIVLRFWRRNYCLRTGRLGKLLGALKRKFLRVEPQTLNKLRFALPTDQLAKAFVPESKRLSEKGFRDLKLKMLDWAFSRTLITSPPYICNRIRGSAAATEIFNEVVRTNRPMSRRNKTDRALSIETEYALSGTRKRQYSTDRETNDSWQNDKAKRSRIDALEHRVNDMFPTIMERFDLLAASNIGLNSSVELSSDDDNDNIPTYTRSESPDDWNAPPINVGLGLEQMPQNLQDFDFLPETMEIEQNIPYGRGCMIFNRPISHHPKRGHQSGPSQQQKQNPSFHTRPLQNQKRKPIGDRGNKGSDRKGQRQLRRRY